jgi:hypothetical protein
LHGLPRGLVRRQGRQLVVPAVRVRHARVGLHHAGRWESDNNPHPPCFDLTKANGLGTYYDCRLQTVQAMEVARAAGWGMVVSARSGETEDTAIVHLATGWDTRQLKVGSFARSERMAKWNEGLRIEEAMGGKAVFAGKQGFPDDLRVNPKNT